MKKTLSLVALAPLAFASLTACSLFASDDGTYKANNDEGDFTLVLDTSENTATFTAIDEVFDLKLTGTLDTDDHKITWNDAEVEFTNDTLSDLQELFGSDTDEGNLKEAYEGTVDSYTRDGDTLTLNLQGEDLVLERSE